MLTPTLPLCIHFHGTNPHLSPASLLQLASVPKEPWNPPQSLKAKVRNKPLDISSFGMIEIPLKKLPYVAIEISKRVVSQYYMLYIRLRISNVDASVRTYVGVSSYTQLQENFALPRCLENAPLLVFAVQVKFSSSQNHPETLSFIHKQTVPQARIKRWKLQLPWYPMLDDGNPAHQLIHSNILIQTWLLPSSSK